MFNISILARCWCRYFPDLEEDYFLGFETNATMEEIENEISSILMDYITEHLEDYRIATVDGNMTDFENSCCVFWCPVSDRMIKYYMEHEDCEFQDIRDLIVFTLDDENNLTIILGDENEDYGEWEDDEYGEED